MEIEIYNSSRPFRDGFCYFNSLVEIAPQSPASDEVRRLADEICEMLSKPHPSLFQRGGEGVQLLSTS
ncbi:hypothetical protein D3C75_1349930 [compost metagenome]